MTGGTQVLSDWIRVRITAAAGSTFLDRMISLVEGAERQKTPNEIALNILLAGMTIIFVFATATIPSFAAYAGGAIPVIVLVALFVTLIPTTIGALLSAIGIAGMDRLVRFNVLAMSGRAVEAAGDVDTLLLDKTGTITLGNRQAAEFRPVRGVSAEALADAASSPRSPTRRRKAARSSCSPRRNTASAAVTWRAQRDLRAVHRPKPHERRRSRRLLDPQGRVDSILAYVGANVGRGAAAGSVALGAAVDMDACARVQAIAEEIAKLGGTPLAVARDGRLLGVLYLKDIVKGGIRERFSELRRMGIRTVMITGDNRSPRPPSRRRRAWTTSSPRRRRRTSCASSARSRRRASSSRCAATAPTTPGARPGRRRRRHEHRHRRRPRGRQHGGPRFRPDQAHRDRRDRQAAPHDPRLADDLLDRQRRGQVLRDHPGDVRRDLSAARRAQRHGPDSPASAILSAIIFNALIIIALIPLALKGVKYRAIGAGALLSRNLLVYGLGGIIVPFVGIKLVDVVITALHLV